MIADIANSNPNLGYKSVTISRAIFSRFIPPRIYREAIRSKFAQQWKTAMDEEIDALKKKEHVKISSDRELYFKERSILLLGSQHLDLCMLLQQTIYQGIINTAYLTVSLEINQYLDELEGYPYEEEGMIYMIYKALYGLRQSFC
ncbi:hypothetical protein PHPALM_28597 [Phytophthora palmivora]|uniref:Uncharacterized protein n=1 Tax=Phytophthora palmivora TaxID=4796 RepID=A0A2P4X9P7_9STRA|nr:hypothetical protein PHPALM_28597 [Phytophthora palmivora]